MRRITIVLASVLAMLGFMAAPAFAQSGHFITSGTQAPVCTDIGT